MATDQERIEQLEREIKELRSQTKGGGGDGEEPLTLAEIRAMSREEVEANWDRVKRSLAQDSPPPAASPDVEVRGAGRIARAYQDRSAAAAGDGNGEGQ